MTDNAILKALEAWYPEDHPLHFDPLHPAIGLAGEAGELLNLYKKERFKSGVSWWDCICGHEKHNQKMCNTEMNNPNLWAWDSNDVWCTCEVYVPKILDGLSGLWYYLRILIYQFELPIATPLLQSSYPEMQVILAQLNMATATFLEAQIIGAVDKEHKLKILDDVNYWFNLCLRELDYTLDELAELNYNKDHNGWKEARNE